MVDERHGGLEGFNSVNEGFEFVYGGVAGFNSVGDDLSSLSQSNDTSEDRLGSFLGNVVISFFQKVNDGLVSFNALFEVIKTAGGLDAQKNTVGEVEDVRGVVTEGFSGVGAPEDQSEGVTDVLTVGIP